MGCKSKRNEPGRQGYVKLKGQKVFKIDQEGGLLSDLGSLPILAKIAQDTGLLKMAVERIEEWRDPVMVEHEIETLFLQRLLLGANGYPDAIDCTLKKDDAALKSVLGYEPDGASLASQSTHTRMERDLSGKSIERLEALPLDFYFRKHKHEKRCITIYVDGSAIRTYGSQQKSEYRGGKKYSQTQFYPLVASTDEGDLLLAKLRSGCAADAKTLDTITKLVLDIRAQWKDVKIKMVMDTAFNEPHLLDFLEEQKVTYVIGYPATSSVKSKFKDVIKAAEMEFRKEHGKPEYLGKKGKEAWQKEHQRIRSLPPEECAKAEAAMAARHVRYLYGGLHDGTNWDKEKTVITRVDYTDKGLDVRCVVSNMTGASAEQIYEEHYCNRAGVETTIKENKSHCRVPLSCLKFTSNQFRFVLQGLIYTLLHTVRCELPRSRRNISIASLRERILKIPVHICTTARQLHWHLSSVHAEAMTLIQMGQKLQARTV